MTDVWTWTRRRFLTRTAAGGLAVTALGATGQTPPNPATSRRADAPGEPAAFDPAQGVPLRWLDGQTSSPNLGVTWGVAWPQGAIRPDEAFTVVGQGTALPSQSWTLARWSDGSIKWSAHAIAPVTEPIDDLRVMPGTPQPTATPIRVEHRDGDVVVDTGRIRCSFPRHGSSLLSAVERDGRASLVNAHLVALHQNAAADGAGDPSAAVTPCQSRIESVVVEQGGPVRAVVKVAGVHALEASADGRRETWLPFGVRFYLYADSDQIRVVHTFIYDGDEHRDFVRGLGVRFDVPMSDEMYDRHVRFTSAPGGLWAEAVRGITGLRRDPGEEVRRLQPLGRKLPPPSEWDPRVSDRLALIPAWGDFTLAQLSADGFQIDKRTKPGHGWVRCDAGQRAAGVGYVGGVSGGVAFGQRDFWQRYPAQLDVRNADTDQATVTLWLWSPRAEAMDLRFYHDGLGMDTHEKQLEGLNITYEDYEPGFGTPHGIARTAELNLWVTPATPDNQAIVDFTRDVITPPLLAASPRSLHAAGVFGPIWGLEDRSTPAKSRIEDNLAFAFESYTKQQEQRRWYGFWDYGDVMHAYDPDRHQWRYDIGGYAWDNSELSPDLWLWFYFLHTGRADVFRFAEAMCKHTGEVDVYHAGRFEGLGTRHNVQHWGCSAKQLRISTAAYRRAFYFLTADERTGELLDEQIDGEKTFLQLDPIRKIREEPYAPDPRALSIGMGTDWSALAMAWFTQWERTGDEAMKTKLINSMETIGQTPFGWFTAAPLMDPQTGKYIAWNDSAQAAGVSHLSAVFGLPEICAELIQNFDVPAFKEKWLMYCRWYNADREARRDALGIDFRTGILETGHSRLTAYAAMQMQDPSLATRAWDEFFGDDARWSQDRWTFNRETFSGTDSLKPVEETPWMATNDAAQWGLAAIQNLALVGKALPATDARVEGPQG